MIVSLPNGRVIELSLDQVLAMDKTDFQYLMSQSYGEEIENPFYGSSLYGTKEQLEPDFDNDMPDEPYLIPLTDMDAEEKIFDEDYSFDES